MLKIRMSLIIIQLD